MRTNKNGVNFQTADKRISDLETFLKDGYKKMNLVWTVGESVGGDGKTIVVTPTRMRTDLIEVPIGVQLSLNIDSGYKLMYQMFNDSQTYVTGVSFFTANTVINTKYKYYRFIAGKVDDTAMVADDPNHINVLTNVDSKFQPQEGFVSLPLTWEDGGIAGGTNDNTVNAARIRTQMASVKGEIVCKVSEGYELLYNEYDGNNKWVKGDGLWRGGTFTINPAYQNIRFVGRRVDGANLNTYHSSAFDLKHKTPIKKEKYAVNIFPESSSILSEKDDKMAHVSTILADEYEKGTFYGVYYNDKTNTVENPTNTTTSVILAKFDVSNPLVVERFNILSPNGSIGGFTQDNVGVREPNIFIDETYVYVYALVTVGGAFKYGVIKFDKVTKTVVSYNDLLLDGLVTPAATLAGQIIEKDGVYYTGYGEYTSGFQGKIIRSTDLINWTTLATHPISVGTSHAMEVSIVFDNNNNIYSALRVQHGVVSDRGIYLTKCDILGNFEFTQKVQNAMETRPMLLNKNGAIFLFVNSIEQIVTELGTVPRSVMLVHYLNGSSLEQIKRVPFESGIHYFSILNYFGSLYMTFSTDVRKLDVSQVRSSINFLPFSIHSN
jgi:hypothetical protein